MRIKDILDYIMVVALVFLSGNIAINSKLLLFTVFGISIGLFFYRRMKFDVTFLYFLIVLMVVLILQSLKFNFFPMVTYVGVYIRILIAYFLLKSIVDFPDKFVRVMYYISIISLVFFIPILLIPEVSTFLIQNFSIYMTDSGEYGTARHSILGLYTILTAHLNKSAGPFWEMGAFGGYLMITLIISYLKDNNLFSKVNIVLIITILTTQSSTAYITLFLFLFFLFLNKTKNIILKIITVLLIFTLSYVAYINLDFLGEKIERQLETAKVMINAPSLEDEDSQRFINIIKDWHDFQGHELIGRGPNSSTRYTTMYDVKETSDIRTVGSTDMIVRYGLPFFLLMLFYMYNSFSTYSKRFSEDETYMGWSLVFVILVLLMSETYFLYPLFWVLLMLQYTDNSSCNEDKYL